MKGNEMSGDEYPSGSGNSKRSSRGSVNNRNRLAAFTQRGNGGDADWGACDPAILQAVIMQITSMGGAVTISLSRDQGAHGMTFLLDNAKQSLWFNGDADLDEELRAALAILESEAT